MSTMSLAIAVLTAILAADPAEQVDVAGELKPWHTVTLTFAGPESAETAQPNPFRDYRLTVTFTQGGKRLDVPGYFAADGQAAETGAAAGRCWRAHFLPPSPGEWQWQASFRAGRDIAAELDTSAGEAVAFDGATGRLTIAESEEGPVGKPGEGAAGRDVDRRGLLAYTGKRYLQFAGTGEVFLKGGADSPENFLAYYEFDGTHARLREGKKQREGENPWGDLHRYQPHAGDWRPGDPTWRGGKGKNIIGALNYLAGQGMNSVYFLTMNVAGDGQDVWPWTEPDVRDRFDVSKLDQWEIVFRHMDRLGLMLHVVTQEQENDQLLDGGQLGLERKLYYRELIARFGHHLALVWNLGEENTNTTAERKAFCGYFEALDPYGHPVVVHTFPGKYAEVYEPLLGFEAFEGPSLQMGDPRKTHAETLRWVERSQAAGRPWFVSLDEIGPANTGVVPDAVDASHDDVRRCCLWGNLMAGGAGCEWYFGYRYPHNDLNCEDWRSREAMWRQTRIALEFFHQYVPLLETEPADRLVAGKDAWCLARPGALYVVYRPGGDDAALQVPQGVYTVQWFNPRDGGPLEKGSVERVEGPGQHSLGDPPADPDRDWVALVRRAES